MIAISSAAQLCIATFKMSGDYCSFSEDEPPSPDEWSAFTSAAAGRRLRAQPGDLGEGAPGAAAACHDRAEVRVDIATGGRPPARGGTAAVPIAPLRDVMNATFSPSADKALTFIKTRGGEVKKPRTPNGADTEISARRRDAR